MKFLDAVEFAKNQSQLIGTTTKKGGTIDDIIIVPSNSEDQEQFMSNYIVTFDAQKCIAPYIKSDVKVIAVIDKKRIRQQGVFIHQILSE